MKLVGVKTNRAAIGAKITVTLDDGSIRYREVSTGGSFGASPLAQHIGLGKGDREDAGRLVAGERYTPEPARCAGESRDRDQGRGRRPSGPLNSDPADAVTLRASIG